MSFLEGPGVDRVAVANQLEQAWRNAMTTRYDNHGIIRVRTRSQPSIPAPYRASADPDQSSMPRPYGAAMSSERLGAARSCPTWSKRREHREEAG